MGQFAINIDRLGSWVQRAQKQSADFTEGSFRLIEYTLVAGTVRWLAIHTSSIFLDLLSGLSLVLLYLSFIMTSFTLVSMSKFSLDQPDIKVIKIFLLILATSVGLLYCFLVYYAVQSIALGDKPN